MGQADWQSRGRADFGASVKYGITSTVTLDATINPDFSQVESDAFEVEVNTASRSSSARSGPSSRGLRPVQLAGTGGAGTMRTAVHTRRIVDPSAGIKLTGTQEITFGTWGARRVSGPGCAQDVQRRPRGAHFGDAMRRRARDRHRVPLDHNRVIAADISRSTARISAGTAMRSPPAADALGAQSDSSRQLSCS